jgi:hypothetical protein
MALSTEYKELKQIISDGNFKKFQAKIQEIKDINEVDENKNSYC